MIYISNLQKGHTIGNQDSQRHLFSDSHNGVGSIGDPLYYYQRSGSGTMRYSGNGEIDDGTISLRSIDEISSKINFRHMGIQAIKHPSGATLYMKHERGPKHTACVVDLEFDGFGDLFGYQALIYSGRYVICDAMIGICNNPAESEALYFAKLHYMGGLPTFGVGLMVTR